MTCTFKPFSKLLDVSNKNGKRKSFSHSMSCSNFSNSGRRIPASSCEQSKAHDGPQHVGVNLEDPFLSIHPQESSTCADIWKQPSFGAQSGSGRERLKRYGIERAGKVWIPEVWGQEELLSDWIDCSAFDESLIPRGIISARAALVEDGIQRKREEENRC